jgi:rare lipoprotein A
MHALSAAHKTLPLPTLVRVTNLENGRSVIVRVNDRGPFVKERLIDLSYAAANQLGYAERGTAHVRVQTLDMPAPKKADILAMGATFKTADHPHGLHTSASGRPATAATVSPLPGKMFIQLGAFSSKDNAIRLQNKLKAHFPTTRATEINLSGKILYRVRMGPFEDTTNMEQIILSLQRKGFQKPMVVIQ